MFINRPSDSRFPNGGIVRDNRLINKEVSTGSINGVPVVEVSEEPIQVYRNFQKPELGPLGRLHPDTTVYDLIFSDSPEIAQCRTMFHDWTFPEINAVPLEGYGQPEKRILPIRNLPRGSVNSTNFFVEQYLYAIINHNLFPTSDFGSREGMRADRSSTLVCVRACDPRYGVLTEATVQYAVKLSAKIFDVVHLAGREILQGEEYFYYTLDGDYDLGVKVSNDWFNTVNYKFNATIYPMVRLYTDYEVPVPIYTQEQQADSEVISENAGNIGVGKSGAC